MNRDRQLKKDMENREVQIHEEYEKNRHLMSEDKVKEKLLHPAVLAISIPAEDGKEKIV